MFNIRFPNDSLSIDFLLFIVVENRDCIWNHSCVKADLCDVMLQMRLCLGP
jgi:hypothetical protein